jgi:hypothetical protein
LIQIAAALLKLELGNESAAVRLAARGVALLRAAAETQPVLRGLKLEPVAREAELRLLKSGGPRQFSGAAFQLGLSE